MTPTQTKKTSIAGLTVASLASVGYLSYNALVVQPPNKARTYVMSQSSTLPWATNMVRDLSYRVWQDTNEFNTSIQYQVFATFTIPVTAIPCRVAIECIHSNPYPAWVAIQQWDFDGGHAGITTNFGVRFNWTENYQPLVRVIYGKQN